MIYKIVKRYFNLGIYSAGNVGIFVKSGKITTEEFAKITGENYEVV